jgi:hypothetical protein
MTPVSGWLVLAVLGMGGLFAAQQWSERALSALSQDDADRVASGTLVSNLLGLATIVGAVVLFVALGRGAHALRVAVPLLVANAWVVAARRLWVARGMPGAGPWRGAVVGQAVGATVGFVAVAGYLHGW